MFHQLFEGFRKIFMCGNLIAALSCGREDLEGVDL